MNESHFVGMPQNQDISLDTNPAETFRNQENNWKELTLEKNTESSIVQIYTKKQSKSKRRKINIFRDNFVPPD